MTKAERLRRVVDEVLYGEVDDEHRGRVAREILAAICEDLGITERSYIEIQGLCLFAKSHGVPDAELEPLFAVIDALHTLLEAGRDD